MTKTLSLAQLPYAADSPIAYLLSLDTDTDTDTDAPSEDEQRDEAQTAAAHHIYRAYLNSIAHVLDATDWRGYPAWVGAGGRHQPSAVAWLDGGLWLHHTLRISEADGARDVLTLIVPCTCTRGFVDIQLDTEDDLIEILTELRPTHAAPVLREPGRLPQRPSSLRHSAVGMLTIDTPGQWGQARSPQLRRPGSFHFRHRGRQVRNF